MKTNPDRQEEVMELEMSSGNVFADLGFDRPEEMQLKSELVRQINNIIKIQSLDNVRALEVLGINENIRGCLSKGQLTELTIEQLFRYLTILGRDLEIVLKPTAVNRDRGNLKVTVI